MISSFLCHRISGAISWRAQFHLKCQRWPTWATCMPQAWSKLLSVGHVFKWLLVMCAFSQIFKVNLLLFQELDGQFNGGIHSSTDLCSGESTAAVCRHFFFYEVLVQVFQPFNFDECWLECLLTHDFNFFSCRDLGSNALTGTIPPQIFTLTNLVLLYAPKRPICVSIGHMHHWVLVLRASFSDF